MKSIRKKGGFTLIEVLVVVVILGVLAGLAVPVYVAQVERSRGAEALGALDATRASMIRYFSQNNTYVGATVPANGTAGTIDFNPNAAAGGQNRFFAYDFSVVPTAAVFTLRATRIAGTVNGIAIPATGAGTVTLDQAGARVGTLDYVTLTAN